MTMTTPIETTNIAGMGVGTPIRRMPTTEDLARSIESLDHTLSETLVLLYHVVQANQGVLEALGHSRAPAPVDAEHRPDLRPLLQSVRGERSGQ